MGKCTVMIRAFLDTSILVGKILNLSDRSNIVFEDSETIKYTNEYVLKELYHVLRKKYGYSEMQLHYILEYFREICIVLPAPSKEEFTTIKIRDKSDRPIVYSAYKNDLVLYIDDEWTYKDAQKYVKVRRVQVKKTKRRNKK